MLAVFAEATGYVPVRGPGFSCALDQENFIVNLNERPGARFWVLPLTTTTGGAARRGRERKRLAARRTEHRKRLSELSEIGNCYCLGCPILCAKPVGEEYRRRCHWTAGTGTSAVACRAISAYFEFSTPAS